MWDLVHKGNISDNRIREKYWIHCMGTAEHDRSEKHSETGILKTHNSNCVMLRLLDTDTSAVSWVLL